MQANCHVFTSIEVVVPFSSGYSQFNSTGTKLQGGKQRLFIYIYIHIFIFEHRVRLKKNKILTCLLISVPGELGHQSPAKDAGLSACTSFP